MMPHLRGEGAAYQFGREAAGARFFSPRWSRSSMSAHPDHADCSSMFQGTRALDLAVAGDRSRGTAERNSERVYVAITP
jgi:hypothetical protein